eukprot:gene15368-20712_t
MSSNHQNNITLPFAKQGIKVCFLRNFINSCGGIDKFKDLTTTDVCNIYVKPRTVFSNPHHDAKFHKSYCEVMELIYPDMV